MKALYRKHKVLFEHEDLSLYRRNKFFPARRATSNTRCRASFRLHSSQRTPRSATRPALAGGGVGLGGRITKPVSEFGLGLRAEELSLGYQPRKEHGAMSPWLPHQEEGRTSGPTLAASSSPEVALGGEPAVLSLAHT